MNKINVPSWVLNPDERRKSKEETEYKEETKKSNFFITYSANVRRSLMTTADARITLYTALQKLGEDISLNFGEGRFLTYLQQKQKKGKPEKQYKTKYETPINWSPPTLLESKLSVEQAPTTGFYHFHLIVKFDGTCMVNLDELQNFIKEQSPLFQRGNLQVRNYKDQSKIIADYVDKYNQNTDEKGEKQLINSSKNEISRSRYMENFPQPIINEVIV